MRLSPSILLLPALLAGCPGKPDHRDSPPATSTPTPPTRTASAQASAAPSAPSTPPQASGPLHEIARIPAASRIVSAGERTFLIAGDILYLIDDKGLQQDPTLHRGLPPIGFQPGSGYDLLGAFPDALWFAGWDLAYSSSGKRQIEPHTARWSKDRWARVSPLEPGERLLGVTLLGKGGRAVALAASDDGALRLLRGNDRSNPPQQPQEEPLATAPAASASASPALAASPAPATSVAPPSASASASASASPPAPRRPSRLRRSAPRKVDEKTEGGLLGGRRPLAGLPTGHLFLVGRDRNLASSVLVERWSPAGSSKIDELPGAQEDIDSRLSVAARSHDDAYVFSDTTPPYLARFDGTAWSAEEVPNKLQIHDLIAADDGAYYMATEGPLFRKAPGDKVWSEVPLPGCGEVLSLALVGGKLWATGKIHGGSLVLLGPPSGKPRGDLPGSGATVKVADSLPGSSPDPATIFFRFAPSPYCTRWYALLRYPVNPSAKKFPDVVATLKAAAPLDGVELITEKSPTWTYLGARVPSAEVGKKIVDAMNLASVAAKEEPRAALFCQDPRAAATIPLSGD